MPEVFDSESPLGPWLAPVMETRSISLPLSFTGNGVDFFIVVFKTVLLTMITAGLYYPWARCQRLNYLYRNTRIGQQNLIFHGSGKEIAIGYLKALAIYSSAYAVFLYARSQTPSTPRLATLIFLLILCVCFPLAVWGGRAYRASRLSYRGIRFGMDKTQRGSFICMTLLDSIFTFISAGIYAPFFLYNLTKRLINASRWGSEHFYFSDSKAESVWLSFTNLLLTVFSGGLLLPATFIRRINFSFRKIRFQGMAIRSELTWWDGYVLFLFPLLVSSISLGVLHPWVSVFTHRHYYSKVRFDGELDCARILQGQSLGNALGETSSSIVGADLGLGD
ncbi:MAG: DUF898 family protein [Proteobacteria bacterium]|nr:MAG: DUF898 family protein [Pseudomonadota bacterium]